MRLWMRVAACAAAVCGCLSVGVDGASAQGPEQLLEQVRGDGPFAVVRMELPDLTLFIPQGDPEQRFNLLGWGNGTGATVGMYDELLRSIASQGIVVAAANTVLSGPGDDVRDAISMAREALGDLITDDPRVCTSGHSQGGGGSFNAANLAGADCVLAVQPDTIFTVRIQQPVDPRVEVISLTSNLDFLAPTGLNRPNVERNSPGPLVQIETAGQSHFAPLIGLAGTIGTVFRAAAIAQLGSDPVQREQFRRLIFQEISADTPGIHEVVRSPQAAMLQ